MKPTQKQYDGQMDFDFGFNQTIETIESITKDYDAGSQITTARNSKPDSDTGTSSIISESAIQSIRVENSGSLVDEQSRGVETVADTGNGRDVRSRSGTTNLGARSAGGQSATGNDGDGSLAVSGDTHRTVSVPVHANNYVISATDQIGFGGQKAKFKDNIAAITLLQKLEAESRSATTEEQTVLVKYVGWGGLSQAFDHRNTEWEKEFRQLSEILSESDYAAARRSTQDSHYTPEIVIREMYNGLERMGFAGGRILEPALGTGHFIGAMPSVMAGGSKVTGCELDPTTAGIAKHLYPESVVFQRGFQDLRIPSDHFDVMVGNPPFGNQAVFDSTHQDLSRFSIHNYFIAKSLTSVRPGGLMAFVVSRHFMDAGNPEVRNLIADQAHLVGAIRLPNSAFKATAGAEVTTDIVFLRKAVAGEVPAREWVDTVSIGESEKEEGYTLNRWFNDNPDRMLGRMVVGGGQFGKSVNLIANEDFDLVRDLAKAIQFLPQGEYHAIENMVEDTKTAKEHIDVPANIKIGGLFVATGNRIAMRLPDSLVNDAIARDYEWYTPKNEKAGHRIRGMIKIRDHLRELMYAERQVTNEDHDLDGMRALLNKSYDVFIKQFGHISSQSNRLAMQDDPEYPLLQSLERDYDRGISTDMAKKHGVEAKEASAAKAAIFTKRVSRPRREIKIETAKDALVASMNDLGRVDLATMVRQSGKSEEDLLRDLAGLIFHNPESNQWETRDKYLTGNVKEKLRIAEEAAHTTERYLSNVASLKAVQPPDLEAVDILVQLGSTWVPSSDVNNFITHLIGDVHRNVEFSPSIGKWVANIKQGNKTICEAQWGTARRPAHVLIEDILTNRDIKVQDLIGRDEKSRPIYKLNDNETAAANQKADEIKQAFLDWIWDDKERRDRLTRLYNDRFNTNVAPSYDGSHLTLPGSSSEVTLREHQLNAIWRGIQEGGTLYDHRVGAGKTFEMIATGIESKRMGLINKPMYVVPNHLLYQWQDAFYELYPSCNILVAEKDDFEKTNRQRLFSRIATGDWDAVVVAHSSFKKIPIPQETLEEILNEQIEDLTQAILQAKRSEGDRITIKEMEKAKDRMESKIKRAAETGPKDNVVTFADLGVDSIFTDELQTHKNLMIVTSMNRISGLGNLSGSDQAFDMFIKARYLQKAHNGRGFYGGTGTPLSNTIAELYTLQRYFQYDDMKRRGIHTFDSWASTFGQVVTGWELDATGVNYKLNSRFSRFQNVPELTALYRSFADVISKQDLERQAAARGERPLTPPIKGGKPQNIIVKRSPLQERFMGVLEPVLDDQGHPQRNADGTLRKAYTKGSIIHRMENLPKDPRIDNPLKITNEARKAGLDYRLIDPDAPDFAGSKINVAVDNIYRIWKEWEELKGTQLVFCDLSTPKGSSQSAVRTTNVVGRDSDDDESPVVSMDELLATGKFSVYDDVKQKLLARGVPENEIRYIHDAKTDLQKAKLFAEVNAGTVRVLLGSTTKMGAGTNVQRLLVAKHDLDAPWRPSDLEQRDGRIERQGNMFYAADPNFEIEMFRYATMQTYDARMWQTIEFKAAGIEQFRRGDTLQRVIEDIASEASNAADMKAASSGNPLILLQVQINADLKKMEAVHSNWRRTRHTLENRSQHLELADARADEKVAAVTAEVAHRNTHSSDVWRFKAPDGRTFGEKQRKDAGHHILEITAKAIEASKRKMLGEKVPTRVIGEYRGYELSVQAYKDAIIFSMTGVGTYSPQSLIYDEKDEFSAAGFFTRIDNFLDRMDYRLPDIETERQSEKAEFLKVREQLGKEFAQLDKLEDLRDDNRNVLAELRKLQADSEYVSTWLPKAVVAPQEWQESVAKALEQGIFPKEDKEIEDLLTGLKAAMIKAPGDNSAIEEVALRHMPPNFDDAISIKLVAALTRELALSQHLLGYPIRHQLPYDLIEACEKATGLYKEESALAFAHTKLIQNKSGNQNENFKGLIIGQGEQCLLQEIHPGVAVFHRFADLASKSMKVGDQVAIEYTKTGLAKVAVIGSKIKSLEI